MSRFLLALLLLAACGVPTALAADAAVKPNFIFILIDDMGWRDLGCYGHQFHETPHIDKLAAEGVRFTQAYAACPVCSPTRASILTGRYPPRYGITDWIPGRKNHPNQKLLQGTNVQELPLDELTLAEALKPAGYVSASIGKWHLGGPEFWPDKQGFDFNIGGTQTGSPPGGYFKFKTPSLQAKDENDYLTDRLTDEALGFIEKHKDKPFFLYLPHYTVHIPLQAKKDLLAKYEKKAGAKPQEGLCNPVYAAMIESLDDGVGKIVKKLADLKLTEKTVIVFTSDNGGLSVKEGPFTPATSNNPLRAGKGYLYEGGLRVPAIVSWPGTFKPKVQSTPIISMDYYPTFLELAGVNRTRTLDGVSLVKLLQGKEPL
ncbi:MAG: sulfatase, partial [Planctomycetia bacterium]|nr:sulfatase [Planctomycetia bacterium]